MQKRYFKENEIWSSTLIIKINRCNYLIKYLESSNEVKRKGTFINGVEYIGEFNKSNNNLNIRIDVLTLSKNWGKWRWNKYLRNWKYFKS